jgi:hypothetical protein
MELSLVRVTDKQTELWYIVRGESSQERKMVEGRIARQ